MAVGSLPLPHRPNLETYLPRRYRTAILGITERTAPLPHRIEIESNRTATAPPLTF